MHFSYELFYLEHFDCFIHLYLKLSSILFSDNSMPRSLLRKSLLAVAAASGSYGTVCYLVPEKFDSQLLYVYRKLPLKVVSYSVGMV